MPRKVQIREEPWRQTIREAAVRNGWMVFTIPDWMYRTIFGAWKKQGSRSYKQEWPDKGYPDLTLLRPPRLVFVEVKGTGGQIEEYQVPWIDGLRESGQEVYVWWPDTPWEEIEATLAR